MNEVPTSSVQLQTLHSHYAFSKMPFIKGIVAVHMFDSSSQSELLGGLQLWTEVRGPCLVTGSTGVGKSICVRRFIQSLDESRFHVVYLSRLPCTVHGFLRSTSRSLGLPLHSHTTDMFDAVQAHLATHEKDHGSHPILVLDDAEGLRPCVLDALRRLGCFALDCEEHFSLLLSGTEAVLSLLAHPELASLRSRILYAHALRPFGFEDTLNYVRFHLKRADMDPDLFAETAVKRLFQASQGRPRTINQLAIQALIQAAVRRHERINGDFMGQLIANHPLFQTQGGEE